MRFEQKVAHPSHNNLWLHTLITKTSYASFNEKMFKFDNDQVQVDLQYIETLAPSDALALVDGFDYTGFKLWPGSEYLCQVIVQHKDLFVGKSLLELGSGVGLAGIVASNYAKAPVLLTDGEDYIVEVLQQNVVRNHLQDKVISAKLFWGVDEKNFKSQYPDGFDVILGGDLIYSKQVIQPLLGCIDSLLAKNGVFFMVYVDRAGTGLGPAFLAASEESPYNMQHTVEPLEVKVEEADTYLYKLTRIQN